MPMQRLFTFSDWFARKNLLASIEDTLGRVINFHYDSNDLLTAITASGLKDATGNVITRTLVRIHYKQLTLGYNFSASLDPKVRNPSPWVIDAIYYPASKTATGRRRRLFFGTACCEVVEQRGMR